MAEIAVMRRLVAILAADIAGYSRLMGEDEAATVQDLKGRQAVVLPLVPKYGGRVIDTAGDGILAEFPSLIHAVECAVEIQKTMAARNRGIPAERRMQFRIGINLGDVIHDDARIYGDGINVAARLENIAEPGGVCISSKVRDELGSRLPLAFRDLGARHLKNIAAPVQVYAIDIDSPAQATPRHAIRKRWLAVGATTVVVALIAAGIGLALHRERQPADSLASRPFRSMVVIPIAPDTPANEDAARTLTDQLTNAVTRAFPDGLVISRGLAEKHRGAQDARSVGNALNVRYVIDSRYGTANDAGQLSVTLIDSLDGSQVWTGAEALPSMERSRETIARLQNQLREAVGDATEVEIQRLPEQRKAAWTLLLQANRLSVSIADIKKSEELCDEALRLEPRFVPALLCVSYALTLRIQNEPERRAELATKLDDVTMRATALAPRDSRTWLNRGAALRFQGNLNGAFAAQEEALRLDPYKGSSVMRRGAMLIYAGRPTEALPHLDQALALDPGLRMDYQIWRCLAFLNMARDKEAIETCESAAGLFPYWTVLMLATAANANIGNMERARQWKAKLLTANPTVSIKRIMDAGHTPAPEGLAQMENWLAGLRKVGIPEK